MNRLIKSYDFDVPKIELLEGDITTEKVDAIVNAANDRLQHGGGVAAAIAHAGGWIIQQQSDEWVRKHGRVLHDQPAYTDAGSLPCRYVIHAVGPIWGEGNEDVKLADAIEGSLKLADKLGLSSIAFPSISTGIFGFPIERAAGIFYDVFKQYISDTSNTKLKIIKMILFSSSDTKVYINIFDTKSELK